MKRSLSLALLGALAALTILYGLRLAQKTSNAAVSALLPRETVAFVHLPDLNMTRDQWHQSDIYQLYREPAVQDFLRKPLARIQTTNAYSQTLQQLEQLDPKDVFAAATSVANNNPILVAGFRFRGNQESAEKVIGPWRSRLYKGTAVSKHETVEYEQHKIDLSTAGPITLATVYDGNWFFAANDLAELKALLDRADGRVKDRKSLLADEGTFREASGEMPAGYSLLAYFQPKAFAEKLAAFRSVTRSQASPDQPALVEQIRSVIATTRFENGKMHDVIYVGVPKQQQDATLTRSSVQLGTKETFLYIASLINFSKQLALLDPSSGGNLLGAFVSKIGKALAAAGIKPEDWEGAFGSELGVLGDWPANMHWPSVLISAPVRDEARARKIASVLAHAIDEDAPWTEVDKDGVHYLVMQSVGSFLAIQPTIAVSNRLMVAGLDAASVEAAMQRSRNPASNLSSSETYKRAERLVPPPTNFFACVDLALLYSRLDATLRPMLLMSAAFMPSVNDYADVGKLPEAEIITKHLSPIVSSQRYKGNGYVAESVGPITLNESGIGIGLLAGLSAFGRSGLNNFSPLGLIPGGSAPKGAAPSASPRPSGTP